jgi:hypothetical protein
MNLPHPGKAKAAICCIAATIAHSDQANFQPDARRRDPLTTHQDLSQEVTVIPVPVPKEKAAGTTAAQSAQASALESNRIVTPLLRNATGFSPFFPLNFSIQPLPTHKTYPVPAVRLTTS